MSWGGAENRAVRGGAKRFGFVTGGAVKVVPRHEAAESAVERPFRDGKRGGPG